MGSLAYFAARRFASMNLASIMMRVSAGDDYDKFARVGVLLSTGDVLAIGFSNPFISGTIEVKRYYSGNGYCCVDEVSRMALRLCMLNVVFAILFPSAKGISTVKGLRRLALLPLLKGDTNRTDLFMASPYQNLVRCNF